MLVSDPLVRGAVSMCPCVLVPVRLSFCLGTQPDRNLVLFSLFPRHSSRLLPEKKTPEKSRKRSSEGSRVFRPHLGRSVRRKSVRHGIDWQEHSWAFSYSRRLERIRA